MTAAFPNGAREDDRLCVEISPGVWLMDDHRWAFYVWARHALARPERLPLCLAHLDAHADAVDGFLPDPAAWLELANETDLTRLHARVAQDSDITLASFIAPALRRGWVNRVHIFGWSEDDDLLDAPLLAAAGASQQVHATMESLVGAVGDQPLLLDLDLDVFNGARTLGEGLLWPDAAIAACIDACAPLLARADIVTIARSFKFSGAPSDTVRLTALVVPLVLARRQASD